jgi:hypothetical protein
MGVVFPQIKEGRIAKKTWTTTTTIFSFVLSYFFVSLSLQLEARVDCRSAKGEVLEGDCLETSIADHGGEGLLVWELADALHKVLVRFAIVGHGLAHSWNHVEGVQIIYSVKNIEGRKKRRMGVRMRRMEGKRERRKIVLLKGRMC